MKILTSRATARALTDLAVKEGPPLTTSELARMTGLSAAFVRTEIKTGHLRAVQMGHGRKRVFRIRVSNAYDYVRALGLL
jgi:excisionase family DNA binding protein